MSQTDTLDGIDGIGERCAFWLRAAYAGSRAKNVANLLGISEAQAKRLLGGARPTSEQLGRLARQFGWRFLAYIMEPAAGPAPFLPSAELVALKERIAAIDARQEGTTNAASPPTPDAWSVRSAGAGVADKGASGAGSIGGVGARDLALGSAGKRGAT